MANGNVPLVFVAPAEISKLFFMNMKESESELLGPLPLLMAG